ncbi:MAG: GNAT family N-acetyltransferase [Actinomycetota bacterium]|nr:GNAT family N-acetyltransferase [Actinomycetota bacterium]
MGAEGVTHTIAIEGAEPELRLPVIVRAIDGGEGRDAISPYGYPGGGYPGGSGAAPDPPDAARVDWSETGLVSVFVRDRVGDPPTFAGGSERSRVHIVAPGDTGSMRKRLREQVRRNERRGWQLRTIPGAETTPADRAAFGLAYGETMRRTGAAERYLYRQGYFDAALAASGAWLLLAEKEGGPPGAGAIAARSDGMLHYYLGGTADAALADSPMKNLFAAMISLATGLELPVNLGGGITPGDSLDEFKRGFAGSSAPFRTHEVVCDPDAYRSLTGARAPASTGFFPAYRVPAT